MNKTDVVFLSWFVLKTLGFKNLNIYAAASPSSCNIFVGQLQYDPVAWFCFVSFFFFFDCLITWWFQSSSIKVLVLYILVHTFENLPISDAFDLLYWISSSNSNSQFKSKVKQGAWLNFMILFLKKNNVIKSKLLVVKINSLNWAK